MFDRHTLNAAVLSLAPAHVARGEAPGTFAELMAAPALCVWDGASDHTIFRDARVNHAFRAWHDAEHKAGQFDFTLDGESLTCEAQCTGLVRAYPSAPAWAIALIRREIIGQAQYFADHGFFPADQEHFHNETEH